MDQMTAVLAVNRYVAPGRTTGGFEGLRLTRPASVPARSSGMKVCRSFIALPLLLYDRPPEIPAARLLAPSVKIIEKGQMLFAGAIKDKVVAIATRCRAGADVIMFQPCSATTWRISLH